MYELKAVRLNPDELMECFFGENLGERHDEILQRTMEFLFDKALEIHSAGVDVIIDFGFWQRHFREAADRFFRIENGIRPEWHYIHVSEEIWRKNSAKRNEQVQQNGSRDYFIDEGIISKFMDPLDIPRREEMDVWIDNRR